MSKSAWSDSGTDANFEYYRTSSTSQQLREWVDDVLYKQKLDKYLDKDFVKQLKDNDFFARLWELELVEWFSKTGLKMIPTNGIGPDFCIQLSSNELIWIEAVLSRPDDFLNDFQAKALSSDSEYYDIPIDEMALRFTSSLSDKAKKFRDNYPELINSKDFVLIAISAFQPSSMQSDINTFLLSILPVRDRLIHFTTDGSDLNLETSRPTHTTAREIIKKNGSPVPKEFLYPGTYYSFIDGVIFSEATILKSHLGSWSSRIEDSTNRPHVFANYSGKTIPNEFTAGLYRHDFIDEGNLVKLEMTEPLKKWLRE